MPDPTLSLKRLGVKEFEEKDALQLLETRNISFAMVAWDGNGSIFWLVRGDPETATEAEKFLVLMPSARPRVIDGIDWIWGDLLMNKTSPENPTLGYVFDESGTLEPTFYKHLGDKALAKFQRIKQ